MNMKYAKHVRYQFRFQGSISFQFAMQQLMKQGFTEFAAEQFLYAAG